MVISQALLGAVASSGGAAPLTAFGGIITQYVDSGDGKTYRVHAFRGSGKFLVSSGEADVDWLLVAGGGGSGVGGAGAGGVLGSIAGVSGATTASGTKAVSAGTYPVEVGVGGDHEPLTQPPLATDGGDSTFGGFTAVGGGYGGQNSAGVGGGGGSGGGGYPNSGGGAGESGQGYAGQSGGGAIAGGGAGNAEAGGTDSTGQGGDGALHWGITETAVGYAGGGGAGDYNTGVRKVGGDYGGGQGGLNADDAQAGAPNTGGGAGGRDVTPTGYIGREGGAGICLIRYDTGLT